MDKFRTLRTRYLKLKKSTGASGSANNEDELVLILPQYKTLDQIISEKSTTEALLTITSVDDEDILVTPGDSKKKQNNTERKNNEGSSNRDETSNRLTAVLHG